MDWEETPAFELLKHFLTTTVLMGKCDPQRQKQFHIALFLCLEFDSSNDFLCVIRAHCESRESELH